MTELQKKIEEAMKEKFVGNYMFSEEELAEIFSQTSFLLRQLEVNRGNTIASLNNDMFFVAMVNAAKELGDTEETFWGLIYRKLMGRDGSGKVYNFLTGLITKLGENKRIIFLDGCTKRYFATILAHSFAPERSTISFFDLCWEIFCNDLNQIYVPNDEVFSIAAESLKNRFAQLPGDDEEFYLGSTAYFLRAGIKRLAIDATEEMTTLIDSTMKLINDVFNRGAIIESTNHFNVLFVRWWQNKENTFVTIRERHNVERAISDYSKITPKYVLTQSIAKLIIPSIRLKSDFDRYPYIEVYSNGKEIFSSKIHTAGSGLTMATKPYFLDIDEICKSIKSLANIEIKIVHNGIILYESRNEIKREFLLFREDREVTAKECAPGNYMLFSPDFSTLSSYPNEIAKHSTNLYTMITSENDVLQCDKKLVLFTTEKQNKKLWIVGEKKDGLVYLKNGEEYAVYNGDLNLAIFSDQLVSDLGVNLDNVTFGLRDFNRRVEGDVSYYNITEIIEEKTPYNVTIFKFSDNNIVYSNNIIKFIDLSVSFDRPFYYDKQCIGEITINSHNYAKKEAFSISNDDVSIKCGDGKLQIKIPIIKWRINDGQWNNTCSDKPIWYKTIHNSSCLEIDVPISLACEVCLSDNSYVEHFHTVKNKFKIGETIHSRMDSVEKLIVFAKIEGWDVIPIFEVWLKESFYKEPRVLFNGCQLIWNPIGCFVGEEESQFRIELTANGKSILRRQVGLAAEKSDVQILEDGFYRLNITLIGKSFLQKETILTNKEICIGDVNKIKFKNKMFVINSAMLTGADSPTTIKKIYIDQLCYLEEKEGSHYYKGMVFIINKYGNKIYLNSMYNSSNCYEKTNPVRIEIMNSKSCWIVAGLDGDSIEDFLGEFTLDEFGKISNLDKKVKGIDYYIYEVRNENV